MAVNTVVVFLLYLFVVGMGMFIGQGYDDYHGPLRLTNESTQTSYLPLDTHSEPASDDAFQNSIHMV